MARAQAALIEIGDGGGTSFARWQSQWVNQVVSFGGLSWDYQQLSWSGVTSGQSSSGDQASITLPGTLANHSLVERAMAQRWLFSITVIEFDEEAGDAGPPASVNIAAATIGECVGGSRTLTSRTIQLGSALSPIGAQFPPRSATTELIGVPCRL
jgi:hypothetical protein